MVTKIIKKTIGHRKLMGISDYDFDLVKIATNLLYSQFPSYIYQVTSKCKKKMRLLDNIIEQDTAYSVL